MPYVSKRFQKKFFFIQNCFLNFMDTYGRLTSSLCGPFELYCERANGITTEECWTTPTMADHFELLGRNSILTTLCRCLFLSPFLFFTRILVFPIAYPLCEFEWPDVRCLFVYFCIIDVGCLAVDSYEW